jgi:hypothetical protein
MPKKVILSDIIDNIMLDADNPRDYLYGVSRTLVIKRAKAVLRELNYAGMKSIKIQIVEITSSGKVIVPDDFVDYFKVFYCVGNYLKPVFFNEAINPTQWQVLEENEADYILTNLGMRIQAGNSGRYLSYGEDSGSGGDSSPLKQDMCGNICSLRGYKYDPNQGAFLLDYIPEGVTHVAIEYVSNPLLDENDPSKLEVHPFFEKVVEAKAYYNLIMSLRDVPANEKDRARRVAEIKYRDALQQKYAKPYEFYQYLMGWKHMVKTSYPCAGGQRIPKPDEGAPSSYKGEFTNFVCQKYEPEKEKQTVRISAAITTGSSADLVYVKFSVLQPLASDVTLDAHIPGLGSNYVYMRKGDVEKTTGFEISSEDRILNVTVQSVNGVMGTNEDENFIYVPDTGISIPGSSTERKTNRITLSSRRGINELILIAQSEYPVASELTIVSKAGDPDSGWVVMAKNASIAEQSNLSFIAGNPTVHATVTPASDGQYDYEVDEADNIYDFSGLVENQWLFSYEHVPGRPSGSVTLVIRFPFAPQRQLDFTIYQEGSFWAYVIVPPGTLEFIADSYTMVPPTGTLTAFLRKISGGSWPGERRDDFVWDDEYIYPSSQDITV